MSCNTILFQSKSAPEFRFLSNYHLCSILYEGRSYGSSEHLYQALKTDIPEIKELIRLAPTPNVARKLGQDVVLSPVWNSMKEEHMLATIRLKFEQNADIRKKLLMTDGFELVEYAPWGDTYWGVGKDLIGQNKLGKILMKVREELK